MKKITAFLMILIFVGAALSAQIKPSAGFMVLGDLGFGNGKIASGGAQHTKSEQLQNFNFGIGMFMDFTYAEIYAGSTYGILTQVVKDHSNWVNPSNQDTRNAYPRGTGLEFGFSILGKYPIELGTITLFPLLGINYNSFMFLWDLKYPLKETSVKTFSQFGIQTGVGFDYDINRRIYFRLEGLFQLRIPGKYMREYLDTYYMKGKGRNVPGYGPVIKAGFGIKFY
jgi:hypothetical protein